MSGWSTLDTVTILRTRELIRETATLSGNVGGYVVPLGGEDEDRMLKYPDHESDVGRLTIDDYLKRLGF